MRRRILVFVAAFAVTACTPATRTDVSATSVTSTVPAIDFSDTADEPAPAEEQPPPATPAGEDLDLRTSTFCLGLTPMLKDLHNQFGGTAFRDRHSEDPVVRTPALLQYIETVHAGMTSTAAMLADLEPPLEENVALQAKLTTFLSTTAEEVESVRIALTTVGPDLSDELAHRVDQNQLHAGIAALREYPELAPYFTLAFGSQTNCAKMAMEINYMYLTGG